MKPVLSFSPNAWAKLNFLRDLGDTEVGGFGISHPDNPLYVFDIFIPKQACSAASVEFDDQSITDMFEDLVDGGFQPNQFSRIWIHTHPGDMSTPSGTDEKTFKDKFGQCDWAIMFILAKGGSTSCRLEVNTIPGFRAGIEIPTKVDFCSFEFSKSEFAKWREEYKEKVSKHVYKKEVCYGSYHGHIPNYKGRFNSVYGPDELDEYYGYFGGDKGVSVIGGEDSKKNSLSEQKSDSQGKLSSSEKQPELNLNGNQLRQENLVPVEKKSRWPWLPK